MLLSEKQAIEAKLDPDAVDQQVGGRGQGPEACQWRRCLGEVVLHTWRADYSYSVGLRCLQCKAMPTPCLQVALEVEAARKAAEAQARIEVEALQQRLRWEIRLLHEVLGARGQLCMACCLHADAGSSVHATADQ